MYSLRQQKTAKRIQKQPAHWKTDVRQTADVTCMRQVDN